MTSALSVICPRCGHHHDVTPASLLLFRELLEANAKMLSLPNELDEEGRLRQEELYAAFCKARERWLEAVALEKGER